MGTIQQKVEQSLSLRVSIQLVSPASGDVVSSLKDRVSKHLTVSIQLVSPASGDNSGCKWEGTPKNKVSIQLVSPASGDKVCLIRWTQHSVSIQLVSPASGDFFLLPNNPEFYIQSKRRFHSISFPSEWGRNNTIHVKYGLQHVSIQLVSPASGDIKPRFLHSPNVFNRVSIQLVSPASGDWESRVWLDVWNHDSRVSIQLVSPASGDIVDNQLTLLAGSNKFPFN